MDKIPGASGIAKSPTEIEPAALAPASEQLANASGAPEKAGKLKRSIKAAGKLAITGALLLAPPAAAIDAAVLAPGASVAGTIAGAKVTSKLDFASGDIKSSFPLDVSPYQKSNLSIGPKTLGANVNFDYNHTDLTDSTGHFSPEKIFTIIRDFSDTKAEFRAIASATEEYYGKVALGSFGGVLLAEVAGGLYLYKRRLDASRQTLAANEIISKDRRFPRAVGKLALVGVAGGLIIPAGLIVTRPSHTTPPRPDKVLAGLGFKDISINMQGQGLVDTTVTAFQNYIKEVDQYYDELGQTFSNAFEQTYATKSLESAPGTLRLIVADDFQGQDGPAKIVGLAAKMYNANLIVVGGDTTATGTSLETEEFNSLDKYADEIPIEISSGHHDSLDALEQMAKAFPNIHIADGKAHKIGGVNILGLDAPDFIPFGSSNDFVLSPAFKGETPDQAIERQTKQLIQAVCDSKKPLIVEMHDDKVGHALAQAGCKNVKIVLDGREYVPKTPTDYGPTTEFTSGSTGGHSAYEPPPQLFAKITAPATFREITINKQTLEPVSSTLITLYPDGHATITPEVIQKAASVSPSITSSSLATTSR